MKKISLFAYFMMLNFYTLSAQLLLEVAGDAKIEKRLTIGNNTDFNMFVGEETGLSTTVNRQNNEGVENTIVGNQAGKLNTTGSYNAFFGFLAGHNNTTGTRNTFLGTRAGFATTTGNDNTFIGDAAGQNNTEGKTNTFIGARAGMTHTEGESNTFMGFHSGFSNQVGNNNTFIGRAAGFNTLTSDNTMIGWFSGIENQNGNRNNFFGAASGQKNVDGVDNIYIGNAAGRDNLMSFNTVIGNFAGAENSGNNNVLLGFKAGEKSGSGVGNIFIGFESGRNETSSNRLYIENSSSSTPLIYGEFDNNKVQVNGSLNVSEFMTLIPSTTPTSPAKGTMYYDSSDDKVKVWNGSMWENLSFTSSSPTETAFTEDANSPCNTACHEENLQLKASIAQLENKLKAYQALQSKVVEMDQLLNQLVKKAGIEIPKVELISRAILAQNQPNPFKGITTIPYFIPLNSQFAHIKIYDMTGRVIEKITIDNFGEGAIDVQIDSFSNGIYHYSLEVDGQTIDTKKMSSFK